MKFTTTKQGFRSLMAAFFLLGALLFGDVQANAQSTTADNLNWKTAFEAMQILDGQINQLDGEIAGLIPGTPAYENVFNHLTYYKLIYNSLEDGVAVPEAVNTNIGVVDINTADSDPQSPVTFDQLLGDVVALLTN